MFKLLGNKLSYNQLCIMYEINGSKVFFYPRFGCWFNEEHRLRNVGDLKEGLRDVKKKNLTREINLTAVVLTPECFGRCLYCYAEETRNKNIKINYDGIRQILSNIPKNYIVQFFGGESVLEIDFIRELDLSCNIEIVTGLFVPSKNFENLLDYASKNKSVYVTVSIDPPDDNYEFHTRQNSLYKDSINIVLERLKQLVDNQCSVSIRSTLTNRGYRIDRLLTIINDYIGQQIPWGIGVVHGKSHDIFSLTQSQRLFIESYLYYYLQDMIYKKNIYIPNPISSWMNIYLNQLENGLCHISNTKGICSFAGRGAQTINWDGEQCICPESATRIGVFDIVPVYNICLICDYLFSCGGLCLWNDPSLNESWCWLTKIAIQFALPLALIKYADKDLNTNIKSQSNILTC